MSGRQTLSRIARLVSLAAALAALAALAGCGSDDPASGGADRRATSEQRSTGDRDGAAAGGAAADGTRPSQVGGSRTAAPARAPAADPRRREREAASPQRLRQYLLEANARCGAVRRAAAPSRPKDPRRLRGYAREMLPRAVMTLGMVSQGKVPPSAQGDVQRLRQTLASLAGIYQRATAETPQGSPALLAHVGAGEALARRDAVGAGLPACVVSE